VLCLQKFFSLLDAIPNYTRTRSIRKTQKRICATEYIHCTEQIYTAQKHTHSILSRQTRAHARCFLVSQAKSFLCTHAFFLHTHAFCVLLFLPALACCSSSFYVPVSSCASSCCVYALLACTLLVHLPVALCLYTPKIAARSICTYTHTPKHSG